MSATVSMYIFLNEKGHVYTINKNSEVTVLTKKEMDEKVEKIKTDITAIVTDIIGDCNIKFYIKYSQILNDIGCIIRRDDTSEEKHADLAMKIEEVVHEYLNKKK